MPHTNNMSKEMDVLISLEIRLGVDPEPLKTILGKELQNKNLITLYGSTTDGGSLTCISGKVKQSVYEHFFSTKLEYKDAPRTNNPSKNVRTWFEKSTGQIPKKFKKEIKSVYLEQMYL